MRGLDRRRSLGLAGILLGLGLALAVAGCGGGGGASQTPETAGDDLLLQSLAEDYRLYSLREKHPPRKIEDLKKLETMASPAVAKVEEGALVVVWGATLADMKEEPGQTPAPEILAYGKDVPEQGGYVLHLDRTVTKMTAEEFKAAPKAVGASKPGQG